MPFYNWTLAANSPFGKKFLKNCYLLLLQCMTGAITLRHTANESSHKKLVNKTTALE